MIQRLGREFFQRDVLVVAPDLIGKILVRRFDADRIERRMITETEAYRGEEDLACHARFGRTPRTEALYGPAGTVYVYLIYGMYWLINMVTGRSNEPQAVLIRGVEGIEGPGRVGRWLEISRRFYGENVAGSPNLWIEAGDGRGVKLKQTPRVGVAYAGEWAMKPWRWQGERD